MTTKVMITFLIIGYFSPLLFAQDLSYWEEINYSSKDTLLTFYVDQQNNYLIGTKNEGIFISSNEGISWEQKNTGLGKNRIPDIISDKNNILYAISWTDGVFRSSNLGDNWIQINNGILTPFYGRPLKTGNNNDLYLSSRDWIFKSTDEGDSWENLTPNYPRYKRVFINLAINSEDNIFTWNWSGFPALFRFDSESQVWDSLLLNREYVSDITDIAINSLDEIFISTSKYGMFRSQNNGDTFDSLNINLDSISISSIIINDYDHIFAIFDSLEIYRSIDKSDSWVKIDSIDNYINFRKITIDKNGYLIGITLDKIFRSKEPVEVFKINTNITPDTIPIIDYFDTLKLNLAIWDEKYGNILSGVDVKILDSLTGQELFLQSDSSGNCIYESIVPENIDSGLYTIKFISSKFAYRNDTIVFHVHVKHETISVEDKQLTKNINIYPNPNNGTFELRFNLVNNGFIFFIIRDILGNEVFRAKRQYLSSGFYSMQYDILKDFQSGLYFISLYDRNLIKTAPIRLIK